MIITNLEIPDEFDTEAIARNLIEHKKVLLLGTSPGVGKSHACRYLDILGYNVLFCCPTNELAKNNDIAVTNNTFFQ